MGGFSADITSWVLIRGGDCYAWTLDEFVIPMLRAAGVGAVGFHCFRQGARQ